MSALVMSVIERFLVFADPNGPVTRAPGHEVRSSNRMTTVNSRKLLRKDLSSGRDSRLGLARPVRVIQCLTTSTRRRVEIREGECLRVQQHARWHCVEKIQPQGGVRDRSTN